MITVIGKMNLETSRRNLNMTENGKKKRKTRRKEENLRSVYFKALRKWLKVIFWHYEDLKTRIDKQDKHIDELENAISLIREKLESIIKGEVNGGEKRKN